MTTATISATPTRIGSSGQNGRFFLCLGASGTTTSTSPVGSSETAGSEEGESVTDEPYRRHRRSHRVHFGDMRHHRGSRATPWWRQSSGTVASPRPWHQQHLSREP